MKIASQSASSKNPTLLLLSVIAFTILSAAAESSALQDSTGDTPRKAPKFEVASVRLVPEKDRGLTAISSSGEPRFTAHNATLTLLIGYAFGIDSGRQIVGAPAWMDSEEFDIAARVENDRKLSYDELKPLLQTLLQERFRLACHNEVRTHKGYALVVAKGGAKLRPDSTGAQHSFIFRDRIDAADISLETFAALLSRPMGAPVVDETGIPGQFDFNLNYDPNDTTDSDLPSLSAALEQELGLKLVRKDISEKVLAIDHIDRIPTDN